MNALVLAVLWMVYYALHSALATDRIKKFFRDRLPFLAQRYRFFYSFFATVNFILLLRFHMLVPSAKVFETGTIHQIIAGVFLLSGLIVGGIALKRYPLRFWFMGVNESERELLTTGINGIVRHPLYTAVLLFLVALLIVFPTWKNIGFSGITFLYILIGCKLEEQKLIQFFGQRYVDYREKTKMLIPWVF